jgi:hypothetical protein
MLGRLLPRDASFFDLFDRHAALIVQGAREFQEMVTPGANLALKARRVKEIEHEADALTHQCLDALHKTFVTPLDRGDIHRLITRMDDVMDFADAAAERLALYEITEMTSDVQDLADVVVRSAEALAEAVRGLRSIDSDDLLRKCEELNRLENEADALFRRALAKLFRTEKDAIKVIKWKEIYEMLETATDRCEDVANTIEGIVVEYS